MKKWEENIRFVTPYVPGEQPKRSNVIKLNTNENPYPPSPLVCDALRGMDPESFRLYPDPASSALVSAIAKEKGLSEDQVFVGVGSDDVLAMCFLTFFNGSDPILFPDITYSFYDVWAELFKIPYETVPLDEDFCIVPEDYNRINGGIVFPNPNAPTGVELGQDKIESILEKNRDRIVIVDEAYVDFGAESALPLLKKYDNLIIVQTFSKSRSMAGMRIGFAMSGADMIKHLNNVKYSFNSYTMSRAAIELGCAAITDREYFNRTTDKIVSTRERTKKKLSELGFTCTDSKANFLFARHESCPAKGIFETLREKGIFVRYFDKPRIDDYLRITIGTDGQMKILFEALESCLGSMR